MADDRIERPSYWDGQRLGATDFLDEQAYHRSARRRHGLGAHTWGVVQGLGLHLEELESGDVRVTLEPGVAVDGYGRSIVAHYPYELPTTLFRDIEREEVVPVWIGYREEPERVDEDPCRGPKPERVSETYRLIIGELEEPRGLLRVADTTAADAEPPIRIARDESVPHQRFPSEPATWFVRLGSLRVDGVAPRFLATGEATLRKGRRVAGLAGGSLYAAEGTIHVADRHRGPLSVSVDGDLRVRNAGGVDDPGGDVHLDGASLRFWALDGGGQPLFFTRTAQGTGTHLDLALGKEPLGDRESCFRVGPHVAGEPAPGTPPITPVFSVCADATVAITGTLSVDGTTSLRGPLTVAGEATLEDALSVVGPTTLTGALMANGGATLSELTVSGTSTFQDEVTAEKAVLLTASPADRRLVLGSSGSREAKLGVVGVAEASYDASAHRFRVDGADIGSVTGDGLDMPLAMLDLDMEVPLFDRVASHGTDSPIPWSALATSARSSVQRARSAIYLRVYSRLTYEDDESDVADTYTVTLRSEGASRPRRFVAEAPSQTGENDVCWFVWMPKPREGTNIFHLGTDGVHVASTEVRVAVHLVGVV